MRFPVRTVLAAASLLVAAFRSDTFAGSGGGYDPCVELDLPLTTTVRHCRDGDPRCDADATCDGACTLNVCFRPRVRHEGAICRAGMRFCPRNPGGYLAVVRTGTTWKDSGATQYYRVRCKRARARCVPAAPSCTVTLTGVVNATLPCRARLLVYDPPHGWTGQELRIAFEGDFVRSVWVQMTGYGALSGTLGDGNIVSLSLGPAGSAPDTPFPYEVNHYEATVAISEIAESTTPHHEVHGHLDATFTHRDGARDVATLTVTADF